MALSVWKKYNINIIRSIVSGASSTVDIEHWDAYANNFKCYYVYNELNVGSDGNISGVGGNSVPDRKSVV